MLNKNNPTHQGMQAFGINVTPRFGVSVFISVYFKGLQTLNPAEHLTEHLTPFYSEEKANNTESKLLFLTSFLKTVKRCLFEFEADFFSYLSVVSGEDEGSLITAADGGRQELLLVSHPNTSTLRHRQTLTIKPHWKKIWPIKITCGCNRNQICMHMDGNFTLYTSKKGWGQNMMKGSCKNFS